MPVLGLRTDELPAFYCRTSGFKLDYNCPDEETVAKIMKTKWDIGLKGGAVVGNPIPEEYAMDPVEMNKVIDRAVEMANEQGIHGKATTPFLLAHIVEMTGGHSLIPTSSLPSTTHTQPARSLSPTARCNLEALHRRIRLPAGFQPDAIEAVKSADKSCVDGIPSTQLFLSAAAGRSALN